MQAAAAMNSAKRSLLVVSVALLSCGPGPGGGGNDGGSGGGGGGGGLGPYETTCTFSGECTSTHFDLELVSGNEQQVVWFHALPEPVVVRLLNRDGAPQAGYTLSWGPLDGWAFDKTSAVTDAQGQVTIQARAGWRYAEEALKISGPEETQLYARLYAVRPPDGVAYPIVGEARAGSSSLTPGQLSVLAGIDEPRGLWWYPYGDPRLFVAGDCRVVAVNQYGFMEAVAGTGVCGFSGDGAAATAAQLDNPIGLFEYGGRLFISDSGNDRIRVVDLDTGIIDTFAGGGTASDPDYGDGADPLAASFEAPSWFEYLNGSHGGLPSSLLVADTGHDRIRRISLDPAEPGVATWLRPTGSCTDPAAFLGCGGELGCSMAQLEYDNSTRDPTLVVSGQICGTRAGGTTFGIVRAGDPGDPVGYGAGRADGAVDAVTEARAMRFAAPPLLSGKDKWLAAADPEGHRVFIVDPHTALFTVKAGDGTAASTGDWQVASSAQVHRPTGLAFFYEELAISEAGANTVRGVRTVVPTNVQPSPLDLDYASIDSGGGERLLPVQPPTKPFAVRVTRASSAGAVSVPGLTVDWTTSATSPCALGATTAVTDEAGVSSITVRQGLSGCRASPHLYNLHGPVSGSGYELSKEVDLADYGTIFTVVNESLVAGSSGVPGLGVLAQLPEIKGAGNDAYSRHYFVAGCAVLKLDNNGFLSEFVGSLATCGNAGDGGPAADALLNDPHGIAFTRTSAGDFLFIADTGNHRVRQVNLDTGVITTVAGGGSGSPASDGDGAAATAAVLSSPRYVAESMGYLYIADNGHNRIRKVALDTGVITAALNPTSCNGGGTKITGCGGRNCSLVEDGLGVAVATTICGSGPGGTTQGIVHLDSDGSVQHLAGKLGGVTTEGAAPTETLISGEIFLTSDFNIFYSEPGKHWIREIDTFDGVTTFAGNGTAGYAANYTANTGPLNAPWALTIRSGHAYIADSGNNAIRYTRR